MTATALAHAPLTAYDLPEINHGYIRSLIPNDPQIARLLFQEMAEQLFPGDKLIELLMKTLLEQAIDLGRLDFTAFQRLMAHNGDIHLHEEAAERIGLYCGWIEDELDFFHEKIDDIVGQTWEEIEPLVDLMFHNERDFECDLPDLWRNFGWDLKWTVESTCEGRVVGIWDEVTDSDPIEMYFEGRCYEWIPAYNDKNYPDGYYPEDALPDWM